MRLSSTDNEWGIKEENLKSRAAVAPLQRLPAYYIISRLLCKRNQTSFFKGLMLGGSASVDAMHMRDASHERHRE